MSDLSQKLMFRSPGIRLNSTLLDSVSFTKHSMEFWCSNFSLSHTQRGVYISMNN